MTKLKNDKGRELLRKAERRLAQAATMTIADDDVNKEWDWCVRTLALAAEIDDYLKGGTDNG